MSEKMPAGWLDAALETLANPDGDMKRSMARRMSEESLLQLKDLCDARGRDRKSTVAADLTAVRAWMDALDLTDAWCYRAAAERRGLNPDGSAKAPAAKEG